MLRFTQTFFFTLLIQRTAEYESSELYYYINIADIKEFDICFLFSEEFFFQLLYTVIITQVLFLFPCKQLKGIIVHAYWNCLSFEHTFLCTLVLQRKLTLPLLQVWRHSRACSICFLIVYYNYIFKGIWEIEDTRNSC